MQEQQSDVLVRNLLEVFNERDQEKRLSIIQELYTADSTFFEMDGSFSGYETINRRVTEVLQTLPPGALFQTVGSMTSNHNVARLSWILKIKDGDVLASGMDVAVLDEGRIAQLYLFIDPAIALG